MIQKVMYIILNLLPPNNCHFTVQVPVLHLLYRMAKTKTGIFFSHGHIEIRNVRNVSVLLKIVFTLLESLPCTRKISKSDAI